MNGSMPRRLIVTAVLTILFVAPLFANQGVADVEGYRAAGYEVAVFAGGCFWCMEPPFDELDGVVETVVGYTGGHVDDPTYRIVAYTETGHLEAILVVYDPRRITYSTLLEVFWINVNPLDATGQFCDRGSRYRSAIFPATPRQRRAADNSVRALEETSRFDRFDRPIATEVRPIGDFWIAEEYHQNYYQVRSFNYRYYRRRCGRDERLEDLWGPPAQRRDVIQRIISDFAGATTP